MSSATGSTATRSVAGERRFWTWHGRPRRARSPCLFLNRFGQRREENCPCRIYPSNALLRRMRLAAFRTQRSKLRSDDWCDVEVAPNAMAGQVPQPLWFRATLAAGSAAERNHSVEVDVSPQSPRTAQPRPPTRSFSQLQGAHRLLHWVWCSQLNWLRMSAKLSTTSNTAQPFRHARQNPFGLFDLLCNLVACIRVPAHKPSPALPSVP